LSLSFAKASKIAFFPYAVSAYALIPIIFNGGVDIKVDEFIKFLA
jgi:hypothetical protein